MLLKTITYEDETLDIASELNGICKYFKNKNIIIGIAESSIKSTHFIKLFCDDDEDLSKFISLFNLYISNTIYKIVLKEFYMKDMLSFLSDTYFFLKDEELIEIRELSMKALLGEGQISDDGMIYCLNRKNEILQKITECLEENSEINLNGFLTFRMRELVTSLESIVDKVVEKYMAEKEYDEFIKLLKYFVDIQESKVDAINILILKNGDYKILDERGNDISMEILNDITDNKCSKNVSMEDVIISGLITNSPKEVIIHGAENCVNKEFVETIEKVFRQRVKYCSKCHYCDLIKSGLKV